MVDLLLFIFRALIRLLDSAAAASDEHSSRKLSKRVIYWWWWWWVEKNITCQTVLISFRIRSFDKHKSNWWRLVRYRAEFPDPVSGRAVVISIMSAMSTGVK